MYVQNTCYANILYYQTYLYQTFFTEKNAILRIGYKHSYEYIYF